MACGNTSIFVCNIDHLPLFFLIKIKIISMHTFRGDYIRSYDAAMLFFDKHYPHALFSRLIASINSDYQRKMWKNMIEWNWINRIFPYALQSIVGFPNKISAIVPVSRSIWFLFASEIYRYHCCTIFLLEIMLQTSCNRIQTEMFAERFPDNATYSDILIGYCALPETVRMLVRFPMYLQIWLFAISPHRL